MPASMARHLDVLSSACSGFGGSCVDPLEIKLATTVILLRRTTVIPVVVFVRLGIFNQTINAKDGVKALEGYPCFC